jgi:carboxyl-terminal processing protease
LIIDLRGNRGGLLRQAVLAADAVLSGGVVAVTVGRDPEASVVWHARPDDLSHGLPVVVLVDGRTASAAEILAAGLQDHGRAVVVGSTTLGKGLVQAVAQLPDGGEIFVSWSRVLAPAGYPIQALGVIPQICTSLGDARIEQQMKSLADGRLAMEGLLLRHAALRPPVPMNTVLDLRAGCPASEEREADLRVAQRLLAKPELYDVARLSLTLPPY